MPAFISSMDIRLERVVSIDVSLLRSDIKSVHKIQADFEFIARANSISYAKRIPLVYFNFTSLDFMHHNGILGNSVCS